MGLFLCPYACRVSRRLALRLCGLLRILVWRLQDRIRRFAFHVFFCPSWRISMRVVADEEVRSAFFRTLSSTPRRAEPGNKATTLNIMQTNAIPMRYAQQRAFSPKKWLDAKSEFFTLTGGETFTRREVLRTCAVFVAIGAAAVAIETSFLLSLPFLAIAAHHVQKLNQEDRQQANGQTDCQKGGAL